MKTKAFLLGISAAILAGCAEYPIEGHLSYRDEGSGAKGGLVFTPGQPPKASVRIPIYSETGELIGSGGISIPIRPVTPTK